jgi:hypothetical protein
MTQIARLAVRDADADRHAVAMGLLASYGITASLHAAGSAFGTDTPGTAWLTFERSCVPVLALLSPAWSSDALGGLASIAEASALRQTLAALGLAVADRQPAQTIEGYVWDGTFHAAVMTAGPARLAPLVAAAQRVCTLLGVSRSYLRVEADAAADAIIDASPVPGDAAAIGRARLAGFCPVWTAWCLSVGRRPLVPIPAVGHLQQALAS